MYHAADARLIFSRTQLAGQAVSSASCRSVMLFRTLLRSHVLHSLINHAVLQEEHIFQAGPLLELLHQGIGDLLVLVQGAAGDVDLPSI